MFYIRWNKIIYHDHSWSMMAERQAKKSHDSCGRFLRAATTSTAAPETRRTTTKVYRKSDRIFGWMIPNMYLDVASYFKIPANLPWFDTSTIRRRRSIITFPTKIIPTPSKSPLSWQFHSMLLLVSNHIPIISFYHHFIPVNGTLSSSKQFINDLPLFLMV